MTQPPTSSDSLPPVSATCEVLVCGGGPAGIGAAVSAAQAGAEVILVERLGSVGGMHTGAGVVNWGESAGGPVYDQLVRRLMEFGAARSKYDPERHCLPGRMTLDTEVFHAAAMELLLRAGVKLLLLTHFESTLLKDGVVEGIQVVNKTGLSRIHARVVVDATADADVAASAGVPFQLGDESDGRLQHCNFRCWLEGVDHERYQREKPPRDELMRLLRRAREEGRIVPPENLFQPGADAFPFNERTGNLQLSNWEFEKVDPLDPFQTSRLLAQSKAALLQFVQVARQYLPGFENCSIRKLPFLPGVRESRRIRGMATLTREDVLRGAKYEDGIARGWFFMDLHDSPPGHTIPYPVEFLRANRPADGDWYEIRYGCLVPESIEGLLVAGRAISAEREAHGSARVMPVCMLTGSAAGIAAATAVRTRTAPHRLDGALIRKELGLEAPDAHTPEGLRWMMER